MRIGPICLQTAARIIIQLPEHNLCIIYIRMLHIPAILHSQMLWVAWCDKYDQSLSLNRALKSQRYLIHGHLWVRFKTINAGKGTWIIPFLHVHGQCPTVSLYTSFRTYTYTDTYWSYRCLYSTIDPRIQQYIDSIEEFSIHIESFEFWCRNVEWICTPIHSWRISP